MPPPQNTSVVVSSAEPASPQVKRKIDTRVKAHQDTNEPVSPLTPEENKRVKEGMDAVAGNSWFSFFWQSTPPKLPQNDPNRSQQRYKEIKNRQTKYIYAYDNHQTTPMLATGPLNTIPLEQLPSIDWTAQAVLAGSAILGKSVELAISNALPNVLADLMRTFLRVDKKDDDRPKNLESYDETTIHKVEELTSYRELFMDAAFSRWRLAGPNPTTLQPCTKAQLDSFVFDHNSSQVEIQRIMQAFKRRELFICDYSRLLQDFTTPSEPTKFCLASMALFEIPVDPVVRKREWIVPLCIQVMAVKHEPQVYFPSTDINWKIAKAIFQSNDGDWHETVVHLGQLHMAMESIAVATFRTLPCQHPLFVLIGPHLEGTLFINEVANLTLFQPGGVLETIESAVNTQINKLCTDECYNLLREDFSFPEMIKKRNMDKKRFPVTYPYRDDGMLLWHAVYNWVKRYVGLYYTRTEDVERDYELQSWIQELRNAGRVQWLKSFDNSVEFLTKFVASFIFWVSAQHATIHYTQSPYEEYTPAFPLATCRDLPVPEIPTSQDYLDYLSAISSAKVQAQVAYFFTEVKYTTLGYYDRNHFVDQRVEKPLNEFLTELQVARQSIQERNVERVSNWDGTDNDQKANWAYKILLPENIPQSINI